MSLYYYRFRRNKGNVDDNIKEENYVRYSTGNAMKPTSEGSIKITENEADKTALLLKADKKNVDYENTVIIGEKEGGREGGREDPIFLVHDFSSRSSEGSSSGHIW